MNFRDFNGDYLLIAEESSRQMPSGNVPNNKNSKIKRVSGFVEQSVCPGNINRNNIIKSVQTKTPQQCKNLCIGNKKCWNWMFSNNKCLLAKSDIQLKYPANVYTGSVSYNVPGVSTNILRDTKLQGSSYKKIHPANHYNCNILCQADAKCVGYTTKRNQPCVLFDKITSQSKDYGYVSGKINR